MNDKFTSGLFAKSNTIFACKIYSSGFSLVPGLGFPSKSKIEILIIHGKLTGKLF